MYTIIQLASVSISWLITANLILSSLLLLWVLRYRRLYRNSKIEAEQFGQSLDDLSEGFYSASLEGNLTNVNAALIKLVGFENSSSPLAEMNELADGWYVIPGRRETFRNILATNGFVKDFVSEVHDFATGETRWITENAHMVRDKDGGNFSHYEGSMFDISDTVQRRKLEDRLEKLSNNLPGGLFQLKFDRDGKYTLPHVSQGFHELMGTNNEFNKDPNSFVNRIPKEHLGRYLKSMNRSFESMTCWKSEFKMSYEDGTEKWMGIIATPELLADGSKLMHGHVNDISARKEAEGKVAYYAYYDPLTRLPNRTYFLHQLEHSIKSVKRTGKFGAVLFLDIDNFKLLNDTQGHATGDLLLQEVASRLQDVVRDSDLVSRFGGDEFVILLDSLGDNEIDAQANASIVARKIIDEFDRGFNLGSETQNNSASIGIVTFDGKMTDVEALINYADMAMYEAKKQGKNNFAIFTHEQSAVVVNMNKLQSRLGRAIKNKELVVYFQPQIDHNGLIYGSEALVRWQHPEMGLLMPEKFIPLAEQSGLICDLTDYVLESSFEHMAKLRIDENNSDLRVAINISPRQIRLSTFIPNLVKLSEEFNIPLDSLTLEVTEYTIPNDIETIILHMQELRHLGVRISLDDFGTGYSSLSRLNELPFDEVKIDGSFIAHLEESEPSRSLVEAIIAMAHALHLDVVAEHVNTGYQERFLLARGVHKFQGYSYCEPLPYPEYSELVSEKKDIRLVS